MKKTVKHPVSALLSIILAMALTCAFTVTIGSEAYNNFASVSEIVRAQSIDQDSARIKDPEIIRANVKHRVDAEEQAATTGKIEEENEIAGLAFRLPASLQFIDDEAFEGTALVNVVIPENVEYIGERAFSDIPTLRKVNIPEKTTTIAGSAFAGSSRVTITGAPGSYARKYARENGIPFAPITVICANAGAGIGISLHQVRTPDGLFGTEGNDGHSDHQPAGRIAGEIKASITENSTAYHIAGRAPPMNA